MTISFRDVSHIALSGAAVDVVLDVPAAAGLGNLMLAFVGTTPAAGSAAAVSTPSGWTEVSGSPVTLLFPSNTASFALFSKRVDETEPSTYTFSTPGFSDAKVGGIVAYENGSPSLVFSHTGALDVESSEHTYDGSSPTVPVTLVCGFYSTASGSSWTPPSGFTERLDDASSGLTLMVCDQVQGSPGFTGDITGSIGVGFNSASVHFSGSDSQRTGIADASQTGLDITGSMTLECWIKLADFSQRAIMTKWNFSANQSYRLEASSGGGLTFLVSPDGTLGSSESANSQGGTFTLNQWHHVAAVYDSTVPTASLYLDGVGITSIANITTVTGVFDGTADFKLGAFNASSSPFSGNIDHVRVWSIVRTEQEINDNKEVVITSASGLEGSWLLNDDYIDQSGNGNTLTPVNSPVFTTDVPFGEESLSRGMLFFLAIDELDFKSSFARLSGRAGGSILTGEGVFLSDIAGTVSSTKQGVPESVSSGESRNKDEFGNEIFPFTGGG